MIGSVFGSVLIDLKFRRPAPVYEIEVDTTFAATHALKLPDGSQEPTHGHDWRVTVTAGSNQLDAMDCVVDFHKLQRIVAAVIRPWGGKHLNDVPPFSGATNPSAERVAERIGMAVSERLPAGVRVRRVCVTEAPGCRAVWLKAEP
jgi:6-pyruvoyltetrahydropterin/6-carboxytetrahydropterin synthase